MAGEPIVVTADADLEDLVPVFLERRREEVDRLGERLAAGDLEAVRVAGHSLKGTGGGYGFDALSEIGADIERAAKAGDRDAVAAALERMRDYLARVEVVYE